jgi:hypothetical protein
MQQVLGCSVSYRIAVGPQQGRKVFTLHGKTMSALPRSRKWPGSACTPESRRRRGKGQSSKPGHSA